MKLMNDNVFKWHHAYSVVWVATKERARFQVVWPVQSLFWAWFRTIFASCAVGCNKGASDHGSLALSAISDHGSLSYHGVMQWCDVIWNETYDCQIMFSSGTMHIQWCGLQQKRELGFCDAGSAADPISVSACQSSHLLLLRSCSAGRTM